MMKKIKHIVQNNIILFLILFVLIGVTGCRENKYDENEFIGKVSDEIEDEYGKFDCVTGEISLDGLYRNTSCGYTVKEPQKGFLGTSEEELFFIRFDEDGIAKECYYGTRPGG